MILDPEFVVPARPVPPPADDEVHVWCAAVEGAAEERTTARWPLSPAEIDRAGRLRFETDRERFIRAHCFLRDLLGRYLRIDPGAVRFRYGDKGKPDLDEGSGGLRFSLSHSEGIALVAVTKHLECGVDVERVRPIPDAEEISRRHFTPSEVEALRSLSATRGPEAFFVLWTYKEAFLKATGEGLSTPLDSFEVTLSAGDGARARLLGPVATDRLDWTLRSIKPAPGYVGAVAVPGRGWSVSCFAWPPGGADRE